MRSSRLGLLLAVALLPLALWAVLPVLSTGSPRSRAASLSSKIDRTRRQIEQKKGRERVLSTTVQRYSRRIGSLQADITVLQRRQVRIQADLDAKRAQLARIQEDLRGERIRLARLRARLAEARTILAARLVALYKADDPDVVTVILESDGFAEMLERTEFMQRVSQQDTRIIQRVRVAKAQSVATAKRLDALEARQQRITAAVSARRDEVVAVKGQLVGRREQYAAARESKRRVLASVAADRDELEGDLAELEAQQERIRARLAAAAAASSP